MTWQPYQWIATRPAHDSLGFDCCPNRQSTVNPTEQAREGQRRTLDWQSLMVCRCEHACADMPRCSPAALANWPGLSVCLARVQVVCRDCAAGRPTGHSVEVVSESLQTWPAFASLLLPLADWRARIASNLACIRWLATTTSSHGCLIVRHLGTGIVWLLLKHRSNGM